MDRAFCLYDIIHYFYVKMSYTIMENVLLCADWEGIGSGALRCMSIGPIDLPYGSFKHGPLRFTEIGFVAIIIINSKKQSKFLIGLGPRF